MARLLLALCAAATLLAVAPASAESRLALVIGQSAYQAVRALPNPVNDAKAIGQALTEDGFEVVNASDLTESQMRASLSEFSDRIASKGPDTVALVFYAGHGVQIDGENYLMPVDVNPKRDADIPLQAIRLNDLLNALTSVPNRMRIVLLDACRDDPFAGINKTAGHGLALVDTRIGVPGTFLSFSTSPGALADDGDDGHSPYTSALLAAVKETDASIEQTFKTVRVAVNKATGGRQTPWDSSSLTESFAFAGSRDSSTPLKPTAKRSVEQWRAELKGKPVATANEIVVADGTDESYEAFVGLFAEQPYNSQARDWLDRHRRMLAFNTAVITNTSASFRTFLEQYPDSDLTPTARKLEERLRNRHSPAQTVAAEPAPSREPSKKSEDVPRKRIKAEKPRHVEQPAPRRASPRRDFDQGSGGGYGGYGRSSGY